MKLLISHPTGNTFVRALLKQAHANEVLESFHTTIAYRNGNWISRLLPQGVFNQYKRRTYPVPHALIHQHPFRETVRLVATKVGLAPLAKHERGWASLDEVYRELDRKTAENLTDSEATHVHCYEDGAFETFQTAQELGVQRSYELPIAHHKTLRRLLRKEAERWPEWEPTLLATRESDEKLHRKDRELEMAETVSCPSQFVLDSMPQSIRENKKCFVSRFGTPDSSPVRTRRRLDGKDPVRFLFVGAMSQRKGLADLLEAFSNLASRQAELLVLGTALMAMGFYRSQGTFTHESPRSHDQVLELMANCDVLVLPSIAEGRALVQQEAMSQGLPILVTPNAGGEDLVKEEETGLLVPASDPVTLTEKLEWFMRNKERIPSMGKTARIHAASYTWKAYAELIIENSFALETGTS